MTSPPEFPEALLDAHRTGVEFLITDLDLALTFLDRADGTADVETAQRTRSLARRAYESVLRFIAIWQPSTEQHRRLGPKLTRVKQRLEAAGV